MLFGGLDAYDGLQADVCSSGWSQLYEEPALIALLRSKLEALELGCP